ncbi:MAG: fibronectin type III domain-containing protein [Acidimicrobiia bacterium]|nr:fibronectin type III domain-containing protein [Acidimicrobiia bacterium]MDH4308427.1 fibronectin type III domain-containing protein [Acidimicrobiia bacterium]MDH5292202.1 fibronectin type III domain-containing protein [Acidimicrobiia bacterium]
MKLHRNAIALAVGLTILGGATTASARASGHGREAVEMGDSRLKFEINATDGDGGVQAFIDADEWRSVSIYDPGGRRVFTATASGRMAEQGGTELFLESAEPPFTDLTLEQLFQRWPEGTYRFRGRSLAGERYEGSWELTHHIPDGPTLVAPLEADGPQDPRATVVIWQPVPAPDGSPIIGYQVLVVEPNTGIDSLPKVTLDVTMPPEATSLAIPIGFLEPDTEYEWEVLAIEASGNQTLSSATFTTGS